MARIKYGALATEIRGSVGGTTFQSNKYGFTIKNKPLMARPNSEATLVSQRILSQVVQAWASLTSTQQALFNSYAASFPQFARNNLSAILSGYNVFVMWNCTRLASNSPISLTTDMYDVVFPPIAPSVTNSAGVLSVDMNADYDEPDVAWACFISPVVRPSINFPPSTFRYMINGTSTGGPFNITSLYLSVFGSLPTAGQLVFLRAVPYGLSTPKVLADLFFKIEVS